MLSQLNLFGEFAKIQWLKILILLKDYFQSWQICNWIPCSEKLLSV